MKTVKVNAFDLALLLCGVSPSATLDVSLDQLAELLLEASLLAGHPRQEKILGMVLTSLQKGDLKEGVLSFLEGLADSDTDRSFIAEVLTSTLPQRIDNLLSRREESNLVRIS